MSVSDKYLYCPRCGNLTRFDSNKYCNFCLKKVSIFNRKEYQKGLLIKSDIDVVDCVHVKEPCMLDGTTEALYRHVWATYIDIPENPNFNREAHETLKADRLEFFAAGGVGGSLSGLDLRDSKPKSASVVGRAIAGGIIAGPTGAVVGAASAIDKNMKEKK